VRHLTRQLAAIVAVGILGGCANRGGIGPPGGPVDTSAPRVERITPESGSVSQRAGAVQFLFNKVISDAPSRGELNQYFLISPTDGEPRVNWHRNHIDVRPRHGFRPNTAYAVTLLPGLADVRGNAMKEPVATVFSTGTSFPRFGILGSIFDWGAERPANGALIEAISRPDSVVFLAVSDSLGQFTLGPFGPGRYTLLGFLDKNANRALDQGELWDSTSVLITNSRPVAELLAIQRDTVGPRMSGLTREDSVTLRVTFDRALDPAQPLSASLFRVQRSDSTELAIASVIGAQAAADSAARRDSTRRDSVARGLITARDTTAAARPIAPPTAPSSVPPSAIPIPRAQQPSRPAVPGRPSTVAPPLPRPSRRAPETAVLLKLASPATFDTGATYRITARGVRNVIGRAATMTRTVTIPKPPPPSTRDSLRRGASPRDSLRRDSLRLRDSVRTPPRRPPTVR
jgi:hypothetical protein